jgi:peptidoglycan-associated lipoprotein
LICIDEFLYMSVGIPIFVGVNNLNSGGTGSMKKKKTTGLIALAVACIPLLLIASCAEKQVGVTEGIQPPDREIEGETAREGVTVDTGRAVGEGTAIGAQRLADEVRTFESENIYFDFDKADLLHEARVVLKEKADWLRKNPSYSVRIEGHCDERGTNEYNLALGERRAYSAKKFLVTLGISKDRIGTLSYGEERPADPGHSEEAWGKNRRDEFRLIK